jgi:hypothetical protein
MAPPPPRPAPLARPPRIAPLRGALVAATFAAVCFTLSYSRELVVSLGGSVATLGGVARYAYSAPTLLGWLVATAALLMAYVAAAELGAPRAVRLGFVIAAVGTFLFAAAAGCGVWAKEIQDHVTTRGGALSTTQATHATNEILELSKTSLGLQAAALVALGIGAFVACAAPRRGVAGRAGWRPALLATGVGFVLAAIAPTYALVHAVWWLSSAPSQAEVLLTTVPPVVAWLAIALGLVLAGAALHRSPRTSRLAVAGWLGGLGGCLFAAALGTQLVLAELELEHVGIGWYTNLAKANSALTWAGWLLFAIAFGVAATRLREHDVLERPDEALAPS